MKTFLLKSLPFLFAAATLAGQPLVLLPAPANISSVFPNVAPTPSNNVLVGDVVFPHFAFGGGWSTTMVLVNLSPVTISFQQWFVDTSGHPLQVSFRTIPQGNLVTTTGIQYTLPPNESFNLQLYDPAPGSSSVKTGWSFLNYDSIDYRIGGYAIFQSGTFEALVPLSSVGDYKFYMPFDDTAGFVTSMAIVNPSLNPITVNFIFRDTFGDVLATVPLTIPPDNQRSFALEAIAPQIKGFAGAVFVQGPPPALSALGFRFNPFGAYATIPILNWSGMFP